MKGKNAMPLKQAMSSELPENLKADLQRTLEAMTKRYGAKTVCVGTHLENLAGLVALVGRDDLTTEERAMAAEAARVMTMAVVSTLGNALAVDPRDAFAVAAALQDFSRQAEQQLCGEQPTPAEVTAEALDVIARASGNSKPTVH